MGGVEDQQPAHALGVVDGEPPGHAAAPVVGHDAGALVAERREQARRVAGQRVEVVGRDAARLVGARVAALIGRDHAEARAGEPLDLARPRVPELREAVEQQHRAARRRALDHEELDLADVDAARLEIDAERFPPPRPRRAGLAARELAEHRERGERHGHEAEDAERAHRGSIGQPGRPALAARRGVREPPWEWTPSTTTRRCAPTA